MSGIRPVQRSRRFLLVILLVSSYSTIFLGTGSAQTVEWLRQFGSSVADSGSGVAVDSTGVYVVGSTYGALPGQRNAGLSDVYLQKFDTNGTAVWTRQFGTGANDIGNGVAADSSGVYVVGSTVGTLPNQTTAGFTDAFVRKYDSYGTELWTRQFGSTNFGTDEALGVAVDATGVYVVGRTNGALFGQTQGSTNIDDAFIRKYDLNGTELWTRQFGTAGQDYARGVAVDSTGVYVSGFTSAALPGQTSSGQNDAFLRKYNSSGTEVWTRQFGTSLNDDAYSVAVSPSGIYVGGQTLGTLPGQTTAGNYDAFVRKYDTSGTALWTRQFGSTGNENVLTLGADASGVYAGGAVFGALPGQTGAGAFDAFVRMYDSSGTEKWTRQLGTAGDDQVFGITASGGAVFVGGYAGGADRKSVV